MQQLGNARLLTMTGDGHTAYDGYPADGFNSECADKAIEAYLFDLALPAEGTKCAQDLAGRSRARAAAKALRAQAAPKVVIAPRHAPAAAAASDQPSPAAALARRGGPALPFRHVADGRAAPRRRGPTRGLGGHWRVIVRNDDHNTFDHVAHTLARHIPGVSRRQGLRDRRPDPQPGPGDGLVGAEGAGRALLGALNDAGLTMAPLEQG